MLPKPAGVATPSAYKIKPKKDKLIWERHHSPLVLCEMIEQEISLFDSGIERYKAGEGPETLIPLFKEICDRAPKTSAAWSCLAWLYMLDNQPAQANKAAQKAVKLDPGDPQTRINLAMTMLETNQKGVRQHVEAAQKMMSLEPELREQVTENIAEGLSRKPDWESLKKVKQWLESS